MIVEVCHVSGTCFEWCKMELEGVTGGPDQAVKLHAQTPEDLDELTGLLLVHGLALKISYSAVKPTTGWWIRPCK